MIVTVEYSKPSPYYSLVKIEAMSNTPRLYAKVPINGKVPKLGVQIIVNPDTGKSITKDHLRVNIKPEMLQTIACIVGMLKQHRHEGPRM